MKLFKSAFKIVACICNCQPGEANRSHQGNLTTQRDCLIPRNDGEVTKGAIVLNAPLFNLCCYIAVFTILYSCSARQYLKKNASIFLLNPGSFKGAQIGIALYDPTKNRYLYNYQADKYFIPASNTKLFTCYSAMKYLEDSLVGGLYQRTNDKVFLQATGDPTFLHRDFKKQPMMELLAQESIKEVELYLPFASEALGRGWAWDDYNEGYMAERDPFPIYGNLATFDFTGDSLQTIPQALREVISGEPEADQPWQITRKPGGHFYTILNGAGSTTLRKTVTLSMEKGAFDSRYLADTLHKKVSRRHDPLPPAELTKVYSQPTDSLLSIMMHGSDNFFAEQTLLMVSQNRLGVMNDSKMIDTLLKTDFAGLPQQPKWVDGSGLSRYNLFTPKDFIWLLTKMKDEFGMERLKQILPTGGEGTLSNLYKNYAGSIYAKTGTLSNHVALSGYLITRKKSPSFFQFLLTTNK